MLQYGSLTTRTIEILDNVGLAKLTSSNFIKQHILLDKHIASSFKQGFTLQKENAYSNILDIEELVIFLYELFIDS